MKTKDKPFETLISSSIREAGLWIAENAEDLVGKTDLRTYLRITVDYQWDEMAPTITIERGRHCEKATKALIGADDE